MQTMTVASVITVAGHFAIQVKGLDFGRTPIVK